MMIAGQTRPPAALFVARGSSKVCKYEYDQNIAKGLSEETAVRRATHKLDAFTTDASRPDGLSYTCRSCQSKQRQQRRKRVRVHKEDPVVSTAPDVVSEKEETTTAEPTGFNNASDFWESPEDTIQALRNSIEQLRADFEDAFSKDARELVELKMRKADADAISAMRREVQQIRDDIQNWYQTEINPNFNAVNENFARVEDRIQEIERSRITEAAAQGRAVMRIQDLENKVAHLESVDAVLSSRFNEAVMQIGFDISTLPYVRARSFLFSKVNALAKHVFITTGGEVADHKV
jgi:DNA repair exonuclease SbcCD ATPase subunit